MGESFQSRLNALFDTASIADIARRIGAPHATVRNYMRGRLPSAEVLIKIADATNVSLNWLLTGRGEMYLDVPSPLDIGKILEIRVAQIVDERLAKIDKIEPRPAAARTAAPAAPKVFDIQKSVKKYNDPKRVMNAWFKFEGREYPDDYGVVFFQGWEAYSAEEKIEAVMDAKKVLDRTLKK